MKTGYANLMTVPPNVRYQERFLKAYREAEENRGVLWKYESSVYIEGKSLKETCKKGQVGSNGFKRGNADELLA